ncbi:hypothetical protein RF11_10363 [Thelohanellus kitauei]|uniref:Uncharacterized protein n=1 Tax=Thelohanellus kitauei TaxID=669202 RepID=A0A0C2IAM5_THEKT|nr:hypothetical protein RF11_10363 [Thelohanellus kitauei]
MGFKKNIFLTTYRQIFMSYKSTMLKFVAISHRGSSTFAAKPLSLLCTFSRDSQNSIKYKCTMPHLTFSAMPFICDFEKARVVKSLLSHSILYYQTDLPKAGR